MKVYLDNAASTHLDPVVMQEMIDCMQKHYGNPSSIHFHGRESRTVVEKPRKNPAALLNTSPSEIFFTSGGTEADNFAISSSIETLGLTHAISSPLEHHAVLHTLQHWAKAGKLELSLLEVDSKGNLNMEQLEALLKNKPRSLVSLMHANNEIGNIYDIKHISNLCKENKAIFHSDTVQTVGHFPIDLQDIQIDYINGAAHKFHGPKGTGFIYINADNKIHPLIHGGAQERNMRGGTENIYGIWGLARALEIAVEQMESRRENIRTLKAYMIERLKEKIAGIEFNGESADLDKSLYTVLNASFPPSEVSDMLLFNLDISQISVSGGSACSSGSDVGSHVLKGIGANPNRASVRFSFCHQNTKEEIDYVMEKLEEIFSDKVLK